MQRFMGVATKNLATYAGWRRVVEVRGDALSVIPRRRSRGGAAAQ
jgi:hypothetical protein